MEETIRMNPRFSVVIPAFNAAATVADAVRAVVTQPLARDAFECIVVDDASSDHTADAAERAGAVVVRLPRNQGPAAARNAGIQRARGEWIAFTDSDCVPSRRWLPAFFSAAAETTVDRSTLALAGKTIGLESNTPAARFMDLIGGLDAETYLRHETMPWAPSCNLAYRRADLLAVGGFDQAFRSYETPDLHLRLTDCFGGNIQCVPSAIGMHRHRATWKSFWHQQLAYGSGLRAFFCYGMVIAGLGPRHAKRAHGRICSRSPLAPLLRAATVASCNVVGSSNNSRNALASLQPSFHPNHGARLCRSSDQPQQHPIFLPPALHIACPAVDCHCGLRSAISSCARPRGWRAPTCPSSSRASPLNRVTAPILHAWSG